MYGGTETALGWVADIFLLGMGKNEMFVIFFKSVISFQYAELFADAFDSEGFWYFPSKKFQGLGNGNYLSSSRALFNEVWVATLVSIQLTVYGRKDESIIQINDYIVV